MSNRIRLFSALVAAAALALAACKDTPKAAPTEPEALPAASATAAADSAPIMLETAGAAAAVLAPASSTCLGYQRRHATLKDATDRLPVESPEAARGRARLTALSAMMTDACN